MNSTPLLTRNGRRPVGGKLEVFAALLVVVVKDDDDEEEVKY